MASSIIGQLRVILGMDTAAYEKGMDDIQRQNVRAARNMERFGARMENIGKNMSVGLTLPLLAIGGAALNMAAKFESGMNRVEAATGAAGKQLDALRQKAIAIGKDKSFTATAADAADIMEMLAKNGATTDQILGGLTESTAKLAAATGGDFAQSADIVTDVLQQFNRRAGETGGIVDKVTGAMLVSKMGFDDYRLAIGQTGGVAGGLGLEFEDMNVALAATSALFASGSDAGTSFKTFLTSLPGKSKEAKGAIEAYGLSFYDAQGNMRSMGEIAQNLQDKLGGLNEQAQSEVLTTIFGTDAMRTAIGLMNQGADGIARISAEINKASAQTQMEARMKGWSGAITQVKKSFEAAAISFGDSGILTAMTKIAQAIASVINAASNLPQPVQLAIGALLGLTAAVGPVVFITGKAISMWSGLAILLAGRLTPALVVTAGATAATGAAATSAAVGFGTLRAAMSFMTSPWAATIGAIALALWGIERASAAAAARNQQLAESFRSLTAAQLDAKDAELAGVVADRARGVRKVTITTRGGKVTTEQRLNGRASGIERRVAEIQRANIEKERKRRAKVKPAVPKPAQLATPTIATPANDNGGKTKGGGKSGPTQQELANRREELRLTAEIEAAQLRGDSATVERLQDQRDLKRQIADYEDAGLTKIEARKAAEGDLAAIASARRVAAQRDMDDQRASVEMDMARLAGDDELALKLERQQELKDRILFFEQQLVGVTDQKLRLEQATTLALEQQAKIDAARASGRAKWVAEDEGRRELELMKLRGESEDRIRAKERELEIQRRIEELVTSAGMSREAASQQAKAEDIESEMARQQGAWRDTFKGAFMAALDGDLGGFVKNWWREKMAKGMENALNSISDLLFNIVSQAFGQGASGGSGGGIGGLFGSILGSVFGTPGGGIGGGLPGARPPSALGFAKGTNGWLKVGGQPGIDRNPVSMALTKGEHFRVLKKGEDMGPSGSSVIMHNDFRGADAGAVAGISAKLDQLDRNLEGRALGAYVDAKQRRFVRA